MRAPTFSVGMLLCVVVAAACAPKAEDIERWKGTQKGPGKLKDAVGNASLSAELRGQAVAALFEIGLGNDATTVLQKTAAAERAPIVAAAVPIFEKRLTGPDPGSRDAKDALFSVREFADAALVPRIDKDLLDWLVKDLTARMSQGGHAGEKILLAIGAPAAKALAPLALPGSRELELVCSLLGRLPDVPSRELVADRLIAEARRRGGGELPEPLLRAIAMVGTPRAGAFLSEVAESNRQGSRAAALIALMQSPADTRNDAVLASCLRVAGDKKAPGKAREAALNVAEKFGPAAVPGLVRLLALPEELLRWRAVEAAMLAGNEAAIEPVLLGLPVGNYKPEDIDSYVVHDMRRLNEKAVPPLKAVLAKADASWVAKVCAVRGLGAVGKAADGAALQPLVSDTTPLKGFAAGATLGKEAQAAQAAVAKR